MTALLSMARRTLHLPTPGLPRRGLHPPSAGLPRWAAAATALAWLAATVLAPAPAGARALHASDSARLHYVSARGSLLFDEGRVTGTLPGSMRVSLRVGSTLSGSFTIYVRGGYISGRGSAIAHGEGTYESFAGTLTATGGSGRYRHARGRARLYGVFDRSDYSLVVQTSGTLYY